MKYSYSTYMEAEKRRPRGGDFRGPRSKVGYFRLTNDGDKAIVRFDYGTNPDEFEARDIHVVKTSDGKYRSVACLKADVHDPDSKCPLCAAGVDYPIRTKFYVKLIQYVVDESGAIKAEPKIWERPIGFMAVMKSFMDEYGDLRDSVFTVTRNGERGCRDTTYSINLALPGKYSEENGYVKDFSGFDGFELAGHSFMVRDFDEMSEFVATGEFPLRKQVQNPDYAMPNASYKAVAPTQALPGANGYSKPKYAQPAHPAPNPNAGPYVEHTPIGDYYYNDPSVVDDCPADLSAQSAPSAYQPAAASQPAPTASQPAAATRPIPQQPSQQRPQDPTVSRPRRAYTY